MRTLKHKILLGPLFDPTIVGRYLYEQNLHCFMYDWNRYYVTEPSSWHPNSFDSFLSFDTEALEKWIQAYVYDWQADLLIWLAPGHQPIPEKILRLPLPKIAIAHDWHLNGAAIELCRQHFDVIVGDQRLCDQLSDPKVRYWPAYGIEITPRKLLPLAERSIDICFIGSINHLHIPERTAHIRQLLELSNRYQVKCLTSVFGEDYFETLSNSKIICNLTQRSEMNLRAYETCAVGALLFTESSNLEVPHFLIKDQEYVDYDTTNLKTKLSFYLENPEVSQSIASAGFKKIHHWQYEQQFEGLLDQSELLMAKRQEGDSINKNQPVGLDPSLYIRHISLSRSPERTREAIQAARDFIERLPENETSLCYIKTTLEIQIEINHCFSKNWEPVNDSKTLIRLKKALKKLNQMFPRIHHPALAFNLGFLHLMLNAPEKAYFHFQQVLQLLPQKIWQRDDVFFQFLLPLNNAQLSLFMLHNLTEITWVQSDFNTLIRSLLPWAMHQALADYFYAQQNFAEAEVNYKSALTLKKDVPLNWLHLFKIYAGRQHWSQALNCLDQYVFYSPNDYTGWWLMASLLKKMNHLELGREVAYKTKAVFEATHLNDTDSEKAFNLNMFLSEWIQE